MVTVSPLMISIHAPHEGERPYLNNFFTEDKHFNPRSPRGGATARRMPTGLRHGDFNPRSPRGGATLAHILPQQSGQFQSTLPTRGSDLMAARANAGEMHFNPRSPRGGATQRFKILARADIFQSTLPTRGSDRQRQILVHGQRSISIHAPHEGERPLSPS